MNYRNYIFTLLFIIVSFFSCKKETGTAAWDIGVISPLIQTSLSLNNIVSDSLLQQNPDTSLKIVYNNTMYNVTLNSLLNSPDTITYNAYGLPFNFTAQPGMQIIDNVDNDKLNFGSAKITKIIVKSGNIVFRIQNNIKEKILCNYQIPCASLDGKIFETSELIPAGTSNATAYFIKKIDISGYTFNMTGETGNSANILLSQIQAFIDPNGNPVNITKQDSIRFYVGFENLHIDYAKGFFGSNTRLSGQQNSPFNLFNKITAGNFSFENMQVRLNITNGFGVEAGFLIHEIKSINTKTTQSVLLTSPLIGTNVNINRAVETTDIENPVTPYKYSVNLSNSNFKQLIENIPDQFEFDMDINTNPLGNVSCGNDFAYNKYGFGADINIEMPLSLIANNLTLRDTINYSSSKPDGYKINHGQLKIIANNGFPFSASIQVLLYDSANMLTVALIPKNNIIESASVDNANKVNAKRTSTILIPMSADKLEHFYTAKKMIIVSRFNTANAGQYIKIYSNYTLDMKITADFDMTVNEK